MSVMEPSTLGVPLVFRTGMGRGSHWVLRPFFSTYLMSMQEPSQPLSSSASALTSEQVSRVTMVVERLSLDPRVPLTKTLGFLSSSTASIASSSSS